MTCISYLGGSYYNDDEDLQDGNTDDKIVSDMVTRPGYVQIMVTSVIVKNMTVNAEAVMAMMRKELQDQRKIFHYFFLFLF